MTITVFLLALLQVIWIDVILSGDNAIVIALACRNLGGRRRLGMILGAGAAVLLRIACTGAVAWLMGLPYLKLVGSLMLLFVATKMVIGGDDENEVSAHEALIWAVMTVVGADIVMSLDNVVAVAAASHGDFLLMCIGLALSIPLVVGGAEVISGFLGKWPILVWVGGAVLGWIAGDMASTDPVVVSYLGSATRIVHLWWEVGGAAVVCLVGAMFSWEEGEANA